MVLVLQKTEQHSDQFSFLSDVTILLHNSTGLFRQKRYSQIYGMFLFNVPSINLEHMHLILEIFYL